MPSGTRQSEAAGIPNDSQESTIFDILRKVLSSEVDRDDARRTATGKIKIQNLIARLNITLSFILQVRRPPSLAAEESEYEQKERSRKGQQADALALEGEEGRDKLR